MEPITCRVDEVTKERLDRYCERTGNKMGEAIRLLIDKALLDDEKKETTAATVTQSNAHLLSSNGSAAQLSFSAVGLSGSQLSFYVNYLNQC